MGQNNNQAGFFLMGAVVGGLIGAGISLLTAPRSGEETREILLARGEELRADAERQIDMNQTEAQRALPDLRRQAAHAMGDLEQSVADARHAVKPDTPAE
ncbi:MAG: YtxH domain-containing protein [Anaerolineae bacterium]